MEYISNAFSLSMLPHAVTEVNTWSASVGMVAAAVAGGAKSVVGHETTAQLFSNILGEKVEANRTSVKLEFGDVLYVGQYTGPRLQEGATELPEGAIIQWLMVEVNKNEHHDYEEE